MAGKISSFVTLNDGNKCPCLGLGTFQGSYDYSASNQIVVDAVKTAIDLGYRHIDTAELYNTEEAIGVAIQEKIKEGVVKREDLYITTKLWNTSHRKELVLPALKKSLKNLQLDYVDMYLIHWPCALKPGPDIYPTDENGEYIFEDDITDYTETWLAMTECKKAGLAKSVGVSNFTIEQLERILALDCIKPAAIQVEVNVYFPNEKLVEFCKSHGIQVFCFSPLHKPARHWAKPNDPFIAKDETLIEIGKRHNKTASQVALRYLIQLDLCIIPKSNSVEHQRANMEIFDFELTQDQMDAIRKNCGKHNAKVLLMIGLLDKSKNYPFAEELKLYYERNKGENK